MQLFKILVFLFCTIFSKGILNAQENFCSGYIITNENDTIKGYLLQANIDAYSKCVFKKNIKDVISIYMPGDILAYRLKDEGKFYISKEAPLEAGNKTLFLEYLIKGKANIYFMRDNDDHYFIETEKNKIIELSERPKLVIKNNDGYGVMYYKTPTYIGKLKYIFSDCPEIFTKIENTKLYPSELIDLVKVYQKKVCNSEQCIVFERKVKPIKLCLGFNGGLSLTKFVFNEEAFTNYGLSEQIGVELEIENLFFSFEQAKVKTGLILNRYNNYTFTGNHFWYNDYYAGKYTIPVDLKTVSLKLPVTFNYEFSFGKIRPYLGVGIMNMFILTENSKMGAVHSSDYGNFLPFFLGGYTALIGAKYMLPNNHNFHIELNFDNTWKQFSTIQVNHFSFLGGYTL